MVIFELGPPSNPCFLSQNSSHSYPALTSFTLSYFFWFLPERDNFEIFFTYTPVIFFSARYLTFHPFGVFE